jgi:hypothetical protein
MKIPYTAPTITPMGSLLSLSGGSKPPFPPGPGNGCPS